MAGNTRTGQLSGKWLVVLACVLSVSCSGARGETPRNPSDTPDGLEACSRAIQEIPATQPENRSTLFAEGCAGLFGAPTCRESIRMSLEAPPELRALMISVACQHAYCGDLAEPRPGLCGLEPDELSPRVVSESWPRFLEGILALELPEGPTEELAESLAGLFSLLLFEPVTVEVEPSPPDTVSPPDRAPQRPPLVVRLTLNDGEYRIGAESSGEIFGPWDLPLRPDEGDLSGLLEAAIRAYGGSDAILQVGPVVEYELVIVLMDALRSGGVENFTLSPLD